MAETLAKESPFMLISQERFEQALNLLVTPDGIQASGNELFATAIFGRDTLRVLRDLLDNEDLFRSQLQRMLLFTGSQTDPVTGEEPGKVLHEHRSLYFNGRQVKQEYEDRMRALAREWGIPCDEDLTVWTSIDATVELIRAVFNFCQVHGQSVLDEDFQGKNGKIKPLRDHLLVSINWATGRIAQSDLGLLERLPHPRIGWQVMRDGRLSYLHANGEIANESGPIAMVEVQAGAYDALIGACELFGHGPETLKWREIAERLRLTTLELFWMPGKGAGKRGYFAGAIDRHPVTHQPRLVKTVTSAAFELLDTAFFDDLPAKWQPKRQEMIAAIVLLMHSQEFLVDAGVRSMSTRHRGLYEYFFYQGPYTTWPVVTNVAARGLWRQGFNYLARAMDFRLLYGCYRSEAFPELLYVGHTGNIVYQPIKKDPDREVAKPVIPATNLGERIQAWTVSAALRATKDLIREALMPDPSDWRYGVTMAANILTRNFSDNSAAIDIETGIEMEKRAVVESSRQWGAQ